MPEDLQAIIDRAKNGTLTLADLQILAAAIQAGQITLATGRQAVSIGGDTSESIILTGNSNQINTGFTLEQLRLIIQELQTFRAPHSNGADNDEQSTDNLLFRSLSIDLTILETINTRLEVIEEIYQAGYLSDSQKQELRQLYHSLQSFSSLNQNLQQITEQADRLIQASVASMRLQLNAFRLSGTTLTEESYTNLSPAELECQQSEAKIFQTFINRLEDSRLGAEWIEKSMEMLIKHASNTTLKQFPDLKNSSQLDDFRLSLKQFLEQVNFSLYWGTYEILDSPEIPLIFNVEHYEIAFRSIKETIPKRLRSETIQEIEACIDYLIGRLRFYE